MIKLYIRIKIRNYYYFNYPSISICLSILTIIFQKFKIPIDNENFDDINKMCDNLEETDIKEMLRLRGFDEESIKHFEDRDEFAEQMYEYFYETFTGEYFHGPKIG